MVKHEQMKIAANPAALSTATVLALSVAHSEQLGNAQTLSSSLLNYWSPIQLFSAFRCLVKLDIIMSSSRQALLLASSSRRP